MTNEAEVRRPSLRRQAAAWCAQGAIDLPDQDVHLWFSEIGDTFATGAERRGMLLISTQEAAQLHRFHRLQDRRRYLVTRVLVRSVLARYLRAPPRSLRFGVTAFGRPYLLGQEALPAGLRFSVSHTDRFVVLAVGRCELGVDTESIRPSAPLNVALRFSALEIRALEQLEPDRQAWRFWELWTFKESYVKARGLGLSLPLDRFSVVLPSDGLVGLEVHPSLNDDPSRWLLWQLQPRPDQLVALCMQTANGTSLRLICRSIQPLQLERLVEVPITRRPLVVAVQPAPG